MVPCQLGDATCLSEFANSKIENDLDGFASDRP
jgi:hypothetical protein